MNNKLNKDIKVLVSQCNNKGELSFPSVFSLFGDLAAEHAPMLNLGSDTLAEKDLFWVAVRTKIKINTIPKMNDAISAETWPEVPGKVRCIRYYALYASESILIEGKTEWAIVNLASGRPQKLSDIYPQELLHIEKTVCNDDFHKISEDFENSPILGKYTVVSTDIDIGQHMNNAKYIYALFSLFSCNNIEKMNISDIEINFKTPCFEGEELIFRIRESDNTYEIGIEKPNGKIAATIRMS